MLIRTPEQDIERILFTEKTIAARVEQLAGELTAKYGDQAARARLRAQGRGLFLHRSLPLHELPDRHGFHRSLQLWPERQVHRRCARSRILTTTHRPPVIIVEDIIDSGLTMKYLRQLFSARNPASITTVSFLDKEDCHSESLKTDLCGFTIPNEFVVGYGLDYANYYRNLPYIGVLRPGVLSVICTNRQIRLCGFGPVFGCFPLLTKPVFHCKV